MSIKKTIDFLRNPTESRLVREINNICDSYSHPWDFLAELCQNSVDSIIRYNQLYGETKKKQHKIEITINCKERSVTLYDTGIGFPHEKFTELLAPHGTDKHGLNDIIGEKGVGLKYTIFISNYYSIKTTSQKARIEGYIENAAQWKNGYISQIPEFVVTVWEEKDFDPQSSSTEIYLRDVEKLYEEEDDIFCQSLNVIEFHLRTQTAIGHLKKVFEKRDLDIEVLLTLVDLQGKSHKLEIQPFYMLPDQFIDQSDLVDLDEFTKKAATMDDKQKAKRLQGKSLLKIGAKNSPGGRKINFYSLLAPTRLMWKDISEKNHIYKEVDGEHEPLYIGGIYIATKGMPTGIRLEPPITGQMSYWANFYMIFEDDNITFDLGRKYVPGRTQGIIKEIAKTLFNDFSKYITYVSTDPPIMGSTSATIQQYEKNKSFEELKKLPELNLDKIKYLKHPDGQEAAVVALFHELVGANIIKGYHSIRTGYRETYDLWALYKIEKDLIGTNFQHLANAYGFVEVPTVIEFKFRAEDILKDFEKDVKFFADIDLIICWDLDEAKLAKQGVQVELINKKDVFFYGSSYKLVWPGAYNLGTAAEKPVIALRKFVQEYSQKKE